MIRVTVIALQTGNDPQYIVKLLAKVITVSLETVDIVENLPALGIQIFPSDAGS